MNSGCRLTFVPAERAERLIRVFASGGQVHGVSVSLSLRADEKARVRVACFPYDSFLIYSALKEKFSHLRFTAREAIEVNLKT